MKKIFKSRIFIFILGGIILGGIGAYATSQIAASSITYRNTTLDKVIDNLYQKADTLGASTKTVCTYQSEGSYGNPGEAGALYDCEVGPNIHKNFYLLNVGTKEAKLIMDENINNGGLTWANAMEYFRTGAGASLKTTWSNIIDIDLPDVQTLADVFPNNTWLYPTDTLTWLCFGTHGQDISSPPYCNSATNQNYAWLFNHLTGCTTGGCTDDSNASSIGYWTNSFSSSNYAYYVYYTGLISRNYGSWENYGVRPVITVLNSNLSS